MDEEEERPRDQRPDPGLLAALPKFQGTPSECPRRHVEVIYTYLSTMQIPRRLRASYFTLSLQAEAASWIYTLDEEIRTDYEALTRSFLEHFQPTMTKHTVLAELDSLRQMPGETVHKYNSRFRLYLAKCRDMGLDSTSERVQFAYVNSLERDLARLVRKRKPESVMDALRVAEEEYAEYLLELGPIQDQVPTFATLASAAAPSAPPAPATIEECMSTMSKMWLSAVEQQQQMHQQLMERLDRRSSRRSPSPPPCEQDVNYAEASAGTRWRQQPTYQRYPPPGPVYYVQHPPQAYYSPEWMPDVDAPDRPQQQPRLAQWQPDRRQQRGGRGQGRGNVTCWRCGVGGHTMDECQATEEMAATFRRQQQRRRDQQQQQQQALALPPPETRVFHPTSPAKSSGEASPSRAANVNHVNVEDNIDHRWRPAIPADNRGYQMLRQQGWREGQGLGQNNQGDPYPIDAVESQEQGFRPGIGAASSSTRSPACPAAPSDTIPGFIKGKMLADEQVSFIDAQFDHVYINDCFVEDFYGGDNDDWIAEEEPEQEDTDELVHTQEKHVAIATRNAYRESGEQLQRIPNTPAPRRQAHVIGPVTGPLPRAQQDATPFARVAVPSHQDAQGLAVDASSDIPETVLPQVSPHPPRATRAYSLLDDLQHLRPNITLEQLLDLAPQLLDEFGHCKPPVPALATMRDRLREEAGILVIDRTHKDPGPFHCVARVNGKNIPNAIVDSGSGANIMPKHICDQLRLQVTSNTNVILKTFAQHQVRPAGVIAGAEVSVNGVRMVLDFLVVDFPETWAESSTSYNLLLGREWLEGVGAVVSWSRGKMTIDDGVKTTVVYNNRGRKTRQADGEHDLQHESRQQEEQVACVVEPAEDDFVSPSALEDLANDFNQHIAEASGSCLVSPAIPQQLQESTEAAPTPPKQPAQNAPEVISNQSQGGTMAVEDSLSSSHRDPALLKSRSPQVAAARTAQIAANARAANFMTPSHANTSISGVSSQNEMIQHAAERRHPGLHSVQKAAENTPRTSDGSSSKFAVPATETWSTLQASSASSSLTDLSGWVPPSSNTPGQPKSNLGRRDSTSKTLVSCEKHPNAKTVDVLWTDAATETEDKVLMAWLAGDLEPAPAAVAVKPTETSRMKMRQLHLPEELPVDHKVVAAWLLELQMAGAGSTQDEHMHQGKSSQNATGSSEGRVWMYIDGAYSRALDRAGVGVVFISDSGEVLGCFSKAIHALSSNEAEYQALHFGLQQAAASGHLDLRIRSDSQLLTRQVRGDYKVHNSRLQALHAQVGEALARLTAWEIGAVPRESNQVADILAKQALWMLLPATSLILEDDAELGMNAVKIATNAIDVTDLEQEVELAPGKFVAIGANVSDTERQQIQDLLRDYSDVLAWDYADLRGVDPALTVHRIKLVPGAKPIQQQQRRMNAKVEDLVRVEINKLMDAGCIYPVETADWVSSIVPVRKSNGSIRICVDYRDLNRATIRDYFPTPFIDVILDAVAGKECYSLMDGFAGYHQIQIAPEDQLKTAFRTPFGIYAFRVLPFGLVNAPATFQRLMQHAFGDLSLHAMRIYLDDFALATARCQHLEALHQVFDRCRKNRIQLNPRKCKFLVSQGRLLGFLVSERGIEIYKPKLEQLIQSQPPQDIRELRRFLGGAGFFRRFVFGYAALTRPLYALLRGSSNFNWTADCQQAYEKLLEALATSAAVQPPDPERPFHLFVSVFDETISAALCQQRDDKTFAAIFFISRLLEDAEKRRSVYDQYCAAVAFAFHKFRHYLSNASPRGATVVHTMVNPLTYLLGRPVLQGYHARLAFQLQEFDFKVKVEKAEVLQPAFLAPFFHLDLPWPEQDVVEEVPVTYVQVQHPWYSDILRVLSGDRCEHLPARMRRRLLQQASHYLLAAGCLYRRHEDGVLLRCLDQDEADRVLHEIHACGGHFAAMLTAKKVLRAGYYWPSLFKDAVAYTKRCTKCQQFATPQQRHQHALIPIEPEGPFSCWDLDFAGPFPMAANQHCYILAATDRCTKWVEAISASRADQETTANFLYGLCCRFGVPRRILSDRGSHFMNQVVQDLCTRLGISHSKSSSYWPQGNGQAESTNKVLKAILSKLVDGNRRMWPQHLPSALWHYRTTTKLATGATPFRLVYGVEAVLPIQLEFPSFQILREAMDPEADGDGDDDADARIRARGDQLLRLDEERAEADLHQRIWKTRMALRDARERGEKFGPGDLVWRLNVTKMGKFQARWTGPFQVVEIAGANSYRLCDMAGMKFPNPVNAHHLKRWYL